MELYLDLQDEEYEVRRWYGVLEGDEPVRPEFRAINKRWSSLLLRLGMFASNDIQKLGREFFDLMSRWLRAARDATENGPPTVEEKDRLVRQADAALSVNAELYAKLRTDLGIPRV